MATQAPVKKKKSLDDFFAMSDSMGKPAAEEPGSYVMADNSAPPKYKMDPKTGKSKTVTPAGRAEYDPNKNKTSMDLTPIGVQGGVKAPEAAPAPAPKLIPDEPKGPYVPMDSQTGGEQTMERRANEVQRREEPGWLERALIGATPLLTGLLTGNSLEGVEASSDYLVKGESALYKRAGDFNDKLDEMKAKRDVAGSVDGKSKYGKADVINDQTGKLETWSTLNGKRHEFLGLGETKAPKGSYDPIEWVDKETGKTMTGDYDRITKQVTVHGEAPPKFAPKYNFKEEVDAGKIYKPGETPQVQNVIYENGEFKGYGGQVAPGKGSSGVDREAARDRRAMNTREDAALKEFMKPNSTYDKLEKQVNGAASGLKMLNDGGPIGQMGLPIMVAKSIFGEVGNLNESEAARAGGSRDVIGIAKRLYTKAVEGELTEEDRKDFYRVFQVAYNHNIRLIKQHQERYKEAIKSRGLDVSEGVDSYVKIPALDPLKKTGARSREERAQNRPNTKVVNGYEFKLNPRTGKYE